jgi:glycosyltransferase involved in cell wall biosynthesis
MENYNTKRKIVILSLVYEPFWSGAEKMVKEIAEFLNKKYDIYIITMRLDNSYSQNEQKNGYTIVRVGNGVSLLNKLLFPVFSLIKIRQFKPDIVHGIMESYAGGALVLCKYFFPKAKRILTLQSGDLDDAKKQSKFLIKIFFKIIHFAPHKITAISNFLAKRAINLGVKKENVFVIPNGVDLSRFSKSEEKIKDRVVYVGRLSWEKGLNYLIEAWVSVIKAVPSAKLVIIGEGKEREAIKKMIKELKITDSVILTGNLAYEKVPSEIKRSEIFVCPSLAEGLGIVFIEAQACGVPPIGTRVGGIPDVIQDGENGLLIEPKNSDQIRDAILKLLNDKELAKRLGERGLETCKRFEWKKILEEIDEIYQDISK